MDSILSTIKKMLGVDDDYYGFDNDIIVGINTCLMNLNQLGIGPSDPFVIVDYTELWSDLLVDSTNFEAVKSYIHLKTRLLFDPPTNSFLIESINKLISEIEWRLVSQSEFPSNPVV